MIHENLPQPLSPVSSSDCGCNDEAPCPDSVPQRSRKATVLLRCCLIKNLHKQCARSLAGSWSVHDNVDIQELHTCGLSNYLYLAVLKEHVPIVPGEPRKALVRVYGEVFRSSVDSIVTDAVNFAILSEKRMGPGLYGLFPGGRIEEFIESRPLTYSELSLPLVIQTVARHMARIHSLNMPVCKQPITIFKMMEKFLSQLTGTQEPPRRPVPNISTNSLLELQNDLSSECPELINGHSDDLEFQSVQELASRFRLCEEYEWIKTQFQNSTEFPVVFCHNDFQENNILVLNKPDRDGFYDLLPIDFEYAGYNYRGFDVGNHFNEWCYDYTHTEPPYFLYDFTRYPDFDQQTTFWNNYLPVYRVERRCSIDNTNLPSGDVPDGTANELTNAELSQLWVETTFGSLYSHLLWAAWSLIQSQISSIRFQFKDYAAARIDAYYKLKPVLLAALEGIASNSSEN